MYSIPGRVEIAPREQFRTGSDLDICDNLTDMVERKTVVDGCGEDAKGLVEEEDDEEGGGGEQEELSGCTHKASGCHGFLFFFFFLRSVTGPLSVSLPCCSFSMSMKSNVVLNDRPFVGDY